MGTLTSCGNAKDTYSGIPSDSATVTDTSEKESEQEMTDNITATEPNGSTGTDTTTPPITTEESVTTTKPETTAKLETTDPSKPAAAFKLLGDIKKTDGSRIKIACIGDSLTAGTGITDKANDSYPAKLGKLLGDGYEVATDALRLLLPLVPSRRTASST